MYYKQYPIPSITCHQLELFLAVGKN